jgi:hypothetical protein
MLRVALAFVVLCLLPANADAERRVALVIGNSAYAYAGDLANPKNDATDVSSALKKRGFEVVDGLDLDKAAFDRKVRDFATALSGADVGVFFYAGHGLQVGGENYLVPIDAQGEAAALDFEMVPLVLVQRVMERQTPTNIILLMRAATTTGSQLARAMGTRSADRPGWQRSKVVSARSLVSRHNRVTLRPMVGGATLRLPELLQNRLRPQQRVLAISSLPFATTS